MDMTLTELDADTTAIGLRGRLDAAGADQVGVRFTAATASGHRHAVVDLTGVDFIASLGLRLLISAARGLAAKDRRLVIHGANELVRGVLEDAAIDQIIPVVDTRDDALALIKAA